VENAHRAGIHILASFVVGFEADTDRAFSEILSFTERANLSFAMINTLCTFPGTDLYYRMKHQGRVTEANPDLCNGIYPTMHYRHISQEGMFRGILATLDRVYAFEGLARKGQQVLGNGAFRNLVEPRISFWVKLRSSIHLLRRFILSLNRHKRRLFFSLIRLIKTQQADVGAVMSYLLFISSIHGYQAFNRRQGRKIIPGLREQDRHRPAELPPPSTGGAAATLSRH
jgi:hypothetical protein